MQSIQAMFIGLKEAGKTSLINKLQQRKELETEEYNVLSFKQGASLVYLLDTAFNIAQPKHMLALMREADVTVLCISAMQGITSQIGELILLSNYTNVQNGIIVISKSDSSTPDAIENLKGQIKRLFADSAFKDAEIVVTSTLSGEGLTELREELIKIKPKTREKGDKIKIPIESSTEAKGMTVITGTVESGSVKKYDKVIMMPWGKDFVVQNVEMHGEVIEEGKPGDRVHTSFKGLYPWDVQLGDLITEEGVVKKSKKLKSEIEITNFFKDELKKGANVLFNTGLQTQQVTIIAMTKDGAAVESAKPGEKVEIETESKLPFNYNEGQNCLIINPEASWRSIKVVGAGTIKDGEAA